MRGGSALEYLLRRDRVVVLASVAGVAALAWGDLFWLSRNMPGMAAMDMPLMDMATPHFAPWNAAYFAFMLAMWTVMMVGMMLPSAAPVLLLYAGVLRKSAAHATPLAPAGWFAAGYVLAWGLFALFATLAQWGLDSIAQLTPMMSLASVKLAASVLIGVGVYQWLPMKDACLANCRSPLSFIQKFGGFQTTARGSMRIGMLHGLYCVGCCWALMLLLFVGGVMNLLWIAVLMLVTLLEKLLPYGPTISKLLGAASLLAGAVLLACAR